MRLLLLPFQLALQLLSITVVLTAIGVLCLGGYALANYLRSPSPAAIENLARATVQVKSATGEGTGAIIRSGSEWEVVTAAHVVGASKAVEIVPRDGRRQTAAVKLVDRDRDIAILLAKAGPGWIALPVSASLPHPAEKVLTRCFFDATARQGPFIGPVDDVHRGQQHVVNINLAAIIDPVRAFSPLTGLSLAVLFGVDPGCSGAPLVDRRGRLIGIVLAGNEQSTIAVGVAGALP
jgi:S1-C subfamily serine protease